MIIALGIILLACGPLFCASDDKTYRLDDIFVTPSRLNTEDAKSLRSLTVFTNKDIAGFPETAISDIAAMHGGIDLTRRGLDGIQADITIRGTTFEQNTILIDGIPVNDPQTGHYSFDIPIALPQVERVEILKGPASSLYGANSFGGAINIVTKPPSGKLAVSIEEAGGTYDFYRGAYSISNPFGPIANLFSLTQSHSSGYMIDTNFDTFTLTNSSAIQSDIGSANFLFGYDKKDYGAATFYSNLYPNEAESIDTRFFKLDLNAERGDLIIAPRLFLRRHRDKFTLDLNRPGWQTNYHTTYSYGAEVNCAIKNSTADLSYGFQMSQDTIDSTNLNTHNRTKSAFFIECVPHIGDLLINIGFRDDLYDDFGWQYAPQASAGYVIFDKVKLRSSVGRSYRVPTFTDLYYYDSANIGSSSLTPETSWTYEAGFDMILDAVSIRSTYFYRTITDAIDWTRAKPTDPWRVKNTGSVKTNGFEFSLDLPVRKIAMDMPIESASFCYTVIDTYQKHDYISKYISGYVKQLISVEALLDLPGFQNRWIFNFRKRVGESGYCVVDTKFTKSIFKKKGVEFEAFLTLTNIFDTSYSEQSGVPMPGRWIRSGATLRF